MVNNPDRGLVVHLFDPAMNLLPYGSLCNLGNQTYWVMFSLTLGAHAQDSYGSCLVCVCVHTNT